jgi:hypothetical protein
MLMMRRTEEAKGRTEEAKKEGQRRRRMDRRGEGWTEEAKEVKGKR